MSSNAMEHDVLIITLDLTLPEVNLVLEALGQLPYARVHTLIESIRDRGQAQVEAAASRRLRSGAGRPPGDEPNSSASGPEVEP